MYVRPDALQREVVAFIMVPAWIRAARADLKEAIEGKDYLILAVPSVFTRSTAKIYGTFCKRGTGNRLCGKRY